MTATEPKERTFGETLNTWVQTVGICIAALWGVYTFIYKEFTVPKSAPVNVSVNLQLKKVGSGSITGQLTAIEMKASATNPSSREVHLLPSAWIAHGIRIAPTELELGKLADDVNEALRDQSIYTVQTHVKKDSSAIAAVGRLFGDTVLKPNETTSRTVLFYVPKDAYDLVDLTAFMPTVAKPAQTQLEWNLDNDQQTLKPTVYRINKNKGRIQITDFTGSNKDLDLQWAGANSAVSLWP